MQIKTANIEIYIVNMVVIWKTHSKVLKKRNELKQRVRERVPVREVYI